MIENNWYIRILNQDRPIGRHLTQSVRNWIIVNGNLDGDSGSLFGNEVKGLNDLELICFLIIR